LAWQVSLTDMYKQPFMALVVLSLVLLFETRGMAEAVFGADSFVANAESVFLVRNQTRQEALAFPPPAGLQRLIVLQVLKGFSTDQSFLVAQASLNEGQRAVLLSQFVLPPFYLPAIQMKIKPDNPLVVWSVSDKGNLVTHGIPPVTADGKLFFSAKWIITLSDVKNDILQQTPLDSGLYEHVIDAVLFPDKFRTFEKLHPKLGNYARAYAAIRDFPRDIPALASLLESPDPSLRAKAQGKLIHLTGITITRPAAEDPASLHAWAMSWKDAWEKERESRTWDEAGGRWIRRRENTASPRAWPPVPLPDSPQPQESLKLTEALQQADFTAFAGAFRAWMDSGVVRDRDILKACTMDSKVKIAGDLQGACGLGQDLPPAPRLRPEMVFNSGGLSAYDRFQTIALLTLLWHYNQFVEERVNAMPDLGSYMECSDLIGRAAYWEPRDVNIDTLGRSAIRKLSGCHGEPARSILLSLFYADPDDDMINAVDPSLASGDEYISQGLLRYAAGPCNKSGRRAARLLALHQKSGIVPILLKWLQDGDPDCRQDAAASLAWIPTSDAVTGLISSYKSETNPLVRKNELMAMAQSEDHRILDILLAQARQKQDDWTEVQIARGLARTRDPSALGTLADMAQRFRGNNQVAWESALAFGYISGLFKGYPPQAINSSGGIEEARLQADMALITEWQKQQMGKR
jgi:hypothetical protein